MLLNRANRMIDIALADCSDNAAMLAHDVGNSFGSLRKAVAQTNDKVPPLIQDVRSLGIVRDLGDMAVKRLVRFGQGDVVAGRRGEGMGFAQAF